MPPGPIQRAAIDPLLLRMTPLWVVGRSLFVSSRIHPAARIDATSCRSLPQQPLDQPVPKRLSDRFRLGMNLKFVVDAAQVERYGVDRDAQFGGSGFVVVAFD